jgi:hypothetical protein
MRDGIQRQPSVLKAKLSDAQTFVLLQQYLELLPVRALLIAHADVALDSPAIQQASQPFNLIHPGTSRPSGGNGI